MVAPPASQSGDTTAVLLAARGAGKRYGPVTALTGADIALAAGEVHAIVGENGAGKSTLAKILTGVTTPDEGTVLLDGRPVVFRRRQEAIEGGIGLVPQALSLVGALTLAENFALGRKGVATDRTGARRALAAASARIGLSVPDNIPTARLSLAERQLGELVIAVAQGARILLLDEPTSMLGPREVERLVACLRGLAADGAAIGLVTHRIGEVLANADRVTVLRGGRVVHAGPVEGLAADDVARMMIGDRDRTVARRRGRPGERTRLEATDIRIAEEGRPLIDGVRIAVRAGEILGIAGVASASQPALADALAGVRRPDRGRITLDGEDVTGDARAAARGGLAFLPDERAAGVVPERSVAVNASLLRLGEAGFRRFGLRRPAAEAQQASAVCARYGVRPPDPTLRAGALSGGNQQKLMIGRELEREPGVIIAHSPSQGLDLAAAAAVRNALVAAADRGAAVVVISADLDEITGIGDRMAVLSGGRIVDEFDLSQGPPDPTRLGRAMADVTERER